MRIRLNIEILNDAYVKQEQVLLVDAIFDEKISVETVDLAQKLLAEALERHTRQHKRFDGLPHWDGTNLVVG